ncbi:hypothetical protein HZB78_04215 [Candidatus Collierbacteria bacterium]|nr:hypothetical protein [Candidatus Collierbacteria bacterium]
MKDVGKISHELVIEIAEKNFDEYKKTEAREIDNDFDLTASLVLEIAKKKKKGPSCLTGKSSQNGIR